MKYNLFQLFLSRFSYAAFSIFKTRTRTRTRISRFSRFFKTISGTRKTGTRFVPHSEPVPVTRTRIIRSGRDPQPVFNLLLGQSRPDTRPV